MKNIPKKKPSMSVIMPDSVLQSTKKEPLDVVMKPYVAIKEYPAEISFSKPAWAAFDALVKCFEKDGFVAEGLLGNFIWGCRQCGYDERMLAAGLTVLRERGYVWYSDENKVPISEHNFDPDKPIWIRYGKKFTDLMVGTPTPKSPIILP